MGTKKVESGIQEIKRDSSITDALDNWRVATRGLEATEASKLLADRLLVIATEAENAAYNVEHSTVKADEAVKAAKIAANHARNAARIARELATLTKVNAEADVKQAIQDIKDAYDTEEAAHERFREAQDHRR